ncbi:MAG: anthranilate synthase component I [Chloroflexi bacterium HGW-Chloroflexi-1]|nr:MAG: anthranilate synthase component I [Chloroflexi bacterium HGW-Chloroflexi-1]
MLSSALIATGAIPDRPLARRSGANRARANRAGPIGEDLAAQAPTSETGRPNLIPVVRELPADLETPVSVYLKLAGQGPCFLLESITGGEQIARYSFIGVNPSQAFVLRGRTLERHTASGVMVEHLPAGRDPLDALRAELAAYTPAPTPGLPRFAGGLVGYLGYEMARFFEPSLSLAPHADLPDAVFLLADTVIAFDHAFGRLLLIANARLNEDAAKVEVSAKAERAAEAAARADAQARLDDLEHRLAQPLPPRPTSGDDMAAGPSQGGKSELTSNLTAAQFAEAVLRAKEYIAAGDIFQVVLSQRFSRETTAGAFDIYRSLRRLNPSPYMFFFDFADLVAGPPLRLIGASPELHVRLEDGRAALRPIAGTRPRAADPAADIALERDLLADPKERAEHVMLVDLARNDLGRVCEYGTVRTPELMTVERYSHVMHIVSHVEGRLRRELDGFDLVRATFPAGTVSGAPKIRAMQIIDELEAAPRGPYAGAVGYFSYDGSLDTCIAIRTLVMRGQTVNVQAGAGIVADSDPAREYQETVNKAKALATAVVMAEGDRVTG